MIKSISDGMASVEETFPLVGKQGPGAEKHDPETGEIKDASRRADRFYRESGAPVDQGRDAEDDGSGSARLKPARDGASDEPRAAGANSATGPNPQKESPKTEAEYITHATAWINGIDRSIRGRTVMEGREATP